MLKSCQQWIRQVLGLVVILACARAAATVPERWIEELELRHQTGNARIPCQWDPQQGLRFRIRSRDGQGNLSIQVRKGDSHVHLTQNEETRPLPNVEFFLDNLPPLPVRSTEAVLKLRNHGWWLYLWNQPIARFPAPFQAPATLLQPNTQLDGGSTGKARFQRVGPLVFDADFMIDVNTKDPLKAWETLGGTWGLHSVLEDVIAQEDPGRVKQQPPQPDKSPNFYSLRGSGKGMYVTGYGFEDEYRVQASMQTGSGEVGLTFYYQDDRSYYLLVLESMPADGTHMVVRLERRSSTRIPRTEVLGRVQVPAAYDQWVMLAVEAYANRIECYVDNHEVLRVEEHLPPSGRFGFYVDSEKTRQFDDFSVRSVQQLPLPNVRAIRFHTVADSGNFYQEPTFWSFLSGKRDNPPQASSLRPALSAQEKWLALGSPMDAPHIFEFAVNPGKLPYTVGLLVGFQSVTEPYYRYLYKVDRDHEQVRLEEVVNGKVSLLDAASWRNLYPDSPRRIRLRADATEDSMLKLYCNDEMVLLHAATRDRLMGASGIYAGADSDIRFNSFDHRFEPKQEYRNQFEKNRIFLEDRYMRNWASPEGEWVKDPNSGRYWHKSDFFGRFNLNLPLVADSEVHLAIEKGQDWGTVGVRVKPEMDSDKGTTLAGYRLELFDGQEVNKILASGSIPPGHWALEPVRQGTIPGYTVYYEGYWVWIRSGGEVVLQYRLPRAFSGTRLHVTGLNVDQLAHTFSHRYQTKDFLFKEAPHEWMTNGGTWAVINRFHCQPSWSHMNGESPDSIAAMWSKYEFSGDFCVELYAGMRQGWYERVGDLNITIMNQAQSPSSGYTLTCGGWDFDESQLFTRLYRNGVVVAETDQYNVPRRREGNRRTWQNPLAPVGRPVHGAWYYLKLRRIGSTIEFYFDNQLQMTWEDPEPIALGSMGIWTYRNSMVVARVKVTADHIQPKSIPSRNLPARPVHAERLDPDERLARHKLVYVGEQPLELLHPDFWEADDAVSKLNLSWHEELRQSPYLVATNIQGSGSMKTASRLPALPVKRIAGFRFLVKRTNRAQFNFHFSMGHSTDAGFVPQKRYFVQLSGTDFSQGPWQRIGQHAIRGLPVREDWHRDGDWQEVTVWLPSADFAAPQDDLELQVKVDGFGNLQPSFVQQGLTGNAPGEAYAIRAFSLIYKDLPELRLAVPELQRWRRFLLFDAARQRLLRIQARNRRQQSPELQSSYFLNDVQTTMANYNRAGLNHLRLRSVDKSGDVTESELLWLRQTAEPDIRIEWAADMIDAVRFYSPSQDQRLAGAQAFAGNVPLKLLEDVPGERIAWLPVPMPVSDGQLPIRLEMNGETIETALAVTDRPLAAPPRLIKLDGVTPHRFSFEDRILPRQVTGTNTRLQHGDPQQGSFLAAFNTTSAQRLPLGFQIQVPLARYPLMQFRYRASRTAQISIQLRPAVVDFAEPMARASQVPYGEHASLDEQWHTWTGFVADANAERPILPGSMIVHHPQFTSVAAVDQTGNYSYFHLDDLSFGPAVHHAEQLQFTPHYMDADGTLTERVDYMILQGPEPWAARTAEQTLHLEEQWLAIPNGQACTPVLDQLPNGVHHLLLRAVDSRGQRSSVSDIPFLMDNQVPKVYADMFDPRGHTDNGIMLKAQFVNPKGAPLDSSALKFEFLDKPVRPTDPLSQHIRRAGSDILKLNWPAMLAPQLDAMHDGDSGTLRISNLRSGSGVPMEGLLMPITINRKKDTRPPSFLPIQYPKNVAYRLCWYGNEGNEVHVRFSRNNPVTLMRRKEEAPYLTTHTTTQSGLIAINTRWNVKTHPWLALQIRRPKPDSKMQISLRLTGGRSFNIPLTDSTPNRSDLKPLEFPTQWRGENGDDWTPIMVNVGDQLAQYVKSAGRVGEFISAIQILWTPTQKNQPLNIRDVTFLAPWTDQDQIAIPIYDAHGVAGIDWEYLVDGEIIKKGFSSERSFAPATLGLPTKNNAWLRCVGRDHAGNRTTPIWLPIPPP